MEADEGFFSKVAKILAPINDDYQILGSGQESLSMIFEILSARNIPTEVTILPNMEFQEDPNMPFQTRNITYQVIDPKGYDWKNKRIRCILGAMGSLKQHSKIQIFEWFERNYGIKERFYINLIHPHTTIATTIRMDGGVHIEPGTVIAPYVHLGFGVTLNRRVSIGHHTRIGKFSTVNPGANIAGSVQIGKNCIIGANAFISDHVKIGHGSIIGAGAIVLKDVPAGVLAYGNPCRVVRSLSESKSKELHPITGLGQEEATTFVSKNQQSEESEEIDTGEKLLNDTMVSDNEPCLNKLVL